MAPLSSLAQLPTPERTATPHSLRRTYASLHYACGDDPVYVAEQGGWTDPTFRIQVYARAVRRPQKLSGRHREALDVALDWARLGTNGENASSEGSEAQEAPAEETAG